MAIKYNVLSGLALLAASQVSGLSWDLENKAVVRETTPSAGNPNIQSMEPMFFKDMGAQRVRVKYGPHSVPGAKPMGNMTAGAPPAAPPAPAPAPGMPAPAPGAPKMKMEGMAQAVFFDRNATKPCNDCIITWMRADLQYADGKPANTDTGMWLHHAVALNRGRKDAVCGKTRVPPQRFFASGNERTDVNLGLNGTSKTGYMLRTKDQMGLLMEFMNESPEARDVIMTIDYEFIPAPKAKEEKFERVESIWLDVGGCMGSDQAVKSNGTSEYEMKEPFEIKRNGRIVGMGGHLHDGGMHLEVKRNDKQICDSVAAYGTSPAYISSSMMPEMPGMPAGEIKQTHVSEISSCYKDVGEFKKGDKFAIKAYYDMDKHMGMKEMDGKLAPVMGISVMYVVAERERNGTMGPMRGAAAGGRVGGAQWAAAGAFGLVGLVAALLL